jgi:acyl-CoA synthetase (AMP-forming)/AMP-acid ligase II
MVLPATVRSAAEKFADRNAYVAEAGWPLSYTDLDRASDEAAAGLTELGVREGDVVGVMLPAGPDFLIAYLAIAKLGAITAGVNDRLAPTERTAVLERADPRLVLATSDLALDPFPTIEVEPGSSVGTILATLRRPGTGPPPLPDRPDRDVAIIFTSGTTGTPKGARYGNRQLAFITATDVGDAWGTGGRGFSGTSFAHLGFITKLPGNLRRGGVNFMMSRWRAPDALALLERERLTTVAGVPTQLALMLREPDFDRYDLSSVNSIVAGGGPITPGLAEEARRRFGAVLATRYSCTEAGIGLGTAFDAPDEDAVVSVGRPLPGVELSLRDPDDPEPTHAVPDGEIGEVCLRSGACMSGYWRDPEATASAFTPDRYVRTGDLGRLDEQGRLRLVGRAKEMYVRGGYNVYPVEVEAVLSTHPDVAAVAVVPRADAVMGEIGVACVVARPDVTVSLTSLRDFARERIAAYKLPEAVHLLAALPLTAGEKIDRGALGRAVAATSPDAARSGGAESIVR